MPLALKTCLFFFYIFFPQSHTFSSGPNSSNLFFWKMCPRFGARNTQRPAYSCGMNLKNDRKQAFSSLFFPEYYSMSAFIQNLWSPWECHCCGGVWNQHLHCIRSSAQWTDLEFTFGTKFLPVEKSSVLIFIHSIHSQRLSWNWWWIY